MSSASRTNGRPALLISALPALDLDLPPTGSAWLVCPDCGVWVEVVRGLVQTHKPAGQRCDGSAQRLAFDLTPAQHAARRNAAQVQLTPRGASPATVRTTRAAFAEGLRHTARREVARVGQNRAVAALRPAGKPSTTMAAAFEAAWERVSRVPVATATAHMATRRPVRLDQVAGHFAEPLAKLDRDAKYAARNKNQAHAAA